MLKYRGLLSKLLIVVVQLVALAQLAAANVICTQGLNDLPTARPLSEVIDSGQVHYFQLDNPRAYRTESATGLDFKSLRRDMWGELFKRFLNPAVMNQWIVRRYKLSNLIGLQQNEIILGLEANHVYMILKDSQNRFTRLDGLALDRIFIRRNYQVLTEGMFFRFRNVTDEKVQQIIEAAGADQEYVSCAHAACSVLLNSGIDVGGPREDVPQTTRDMLNVVLREGFSENGVPIKVDVYKTSTMDLNRFFDSAEHLSTIATGVRNGRISGYLMAFKYSMQTILRWVFVRE